MNKLEFFDDDTNARDWYKGVKRAAERYAYLYHEHEIIKDGDDELPKFVEDAKENIKKIVVAYLDDVAEHMTMDIIRDTIDKDGAVEMDENLASYYNWFFCLHEGDNGYVYPVD